MTQISKQVTVEGVDAQTIFSKFDKLEKLIIDITNASSGVSNQEQLLTREEVAKLLKISLPTLHDWTNKEILRSYRVGNLIRYKAEEVMIALVPVMKYNYKSRKSN